MKPLTYLALFACGLAAADLAMGLGSEAQRGGRRGGSDRARGPVEVHEVPTAAGIAWFGTWDAALAEAERTKRPILFMSAAPQCQNVPGVW